MPMAPRAAAASRLRLALVFTVLFAGVQGGSAQGGGHAEAHVKHAKGRFVLGKQARVMQQTEDGMTQEEMEAMFEENWPPVPPSPSVPDGPPPAMGTSSSSSSSSESDDQTAALEAPPEGSTQASSQVTHGVPHPTTNTTNTTTTTDTLPPSPKKLGWGKNKPPKSPRPPKPPGKWAKKQPPSPPGSSSGTPPPISGDEEWSMPDAPFPDAPPPEPLGETSDGGASDDPQLVGDFSQVGVGHIVAVHMIHIPGSNKFLFMERPSGKHPDKSWAIAGYWDQDRLNFTNIDATDSLFCAGHTLTAQGDILVVGGHIAKSGYADGLKGLRVFNRTTMTLTRIGDLLAPRWYPSATLLPNGFIFIVGGTIKPGSGTGVTSYYELWDPSNPTVTYKRDLSKQFVSKTFDIYYPNNYVLPNGMLFMYCNTYGEIIEPLQGTRKAVVPMLGDNTKIHTEYPYTGTSVMLPLYPENAYGVEIVYFGGQYSYGYVNTTASNKAWRLQVTIQSDGEYDFNDGWYPETMLSPRVMPDTVLLPNGQVVILNGATKGMAGDNIKGGRAKCNEPNFFPELYTPNAMYGERFTPLKRNLIPRLYHSTAALTEDGTVLVAGCDRCANFWSTDTCMSKSPWGLSEYRIEVLRPPVWFDFTSKPVIDTVDSDTLFFDQPLNLVYHMFDMTMIADRAVLVAPSATTHSTNMHQRVVGLRITKNDPFDDSFDMTVLGPESPNLAPPGMYMLFLLNGNVYSRSVWVNLQHAPARKRHHTRL